MPRVDPDDLPASGPECDRRLAWLDRPRAAPEPAEGRCDGCDRALLTAARAPTLIGAALAAAQAEVSAVMAMAAASARSRA